jgi:predicted nucleic acid-binding protein
MKRCLLDSSFLIDLLNETAAGENGPARSWLARHPRTELWISPVTCAEVLEGAEDPAEVAAALSAFRWQPIGHRHAIRVAALQRQSTRRLGENDAWQVAVAQTMDAVLIGHDPKAFVRPGLRHEDHRAS